MDKISVIVPMYNVQKYIRANVESLINQKYKNLEIIYVDDGSTDDSGKIIDEYANKDNRIKVIHKENAGVSIARNIGLKNTTGDFITFADSDDIVDEREYEVLYNLIKTHNADASFCELKRFYEGEEIIKSDSESTIVELNTSEALSKILLDRNVGNYFPIKMFKKELFDNIYFPEGKAYEDVATLYKVIDKAKKIVYKNEKLYYYLVGREGSTTSTFSEKKIKDSMEAYYSQYKFLIQKYDTIKNFIYTEYIKSYTSALEKMCLNKYLNLFNSEDVLQKYTEFKNAMNFVDKEFLKDNLEVYRLISSIVIFYDKKSYWDKFEEILKLKSE